MDEAKVREKLEMDENTPHFHVDGITGFVDENNSKVYLLRGDINPELDREGRLVAEDIKTKVLCILEMSPQTMLRIAKWFDDLAKSYNGVKNQKKRMYAPEFG